VVTSLNRNEMKVLHAVNIQSQKDSDYSPGRTFIASTEPRGLSARFLTDPTTVVAGSEEKSDEGPSTKKRWKRVPNFRSGCTKESVAYNLQFKVGSIAMQKIPATKLRKMYL